MNWCNRGVRRTGGQDLGIVALIRPGQPVGRSFSRGRFQVIELAGLFLELVEDIQHEFHCAFGKSFPLWAVNTAANGHLAGFVHPDQPDG